MTCAKWISTNLPHYLVNKKDYRWSIGQCEDTKDWTLWAKDSAGEDHAIADFFSLEDATASAKALGIPTPSVEYYENIHEGDVFVERNTVKKGIYCILKCEGKLYWWSPDLCGGLPSVLVTLKEKDFSPDLYSRHAWSELRWDLHKK